MVELRRIHLIHLNEGTALAVAVMDDGSARQAVCILPYAASQEELGSVATALNAALAGLTVVNMAERLSSLHGPAADIAPQVVGMLGRDGSRSAVSQSGLLAMLHQPEFQVGDTARRVVELLEGGSLLAGLAERVAAEPGVHVIIGSENGLVEMSDCTVVTAAYTSQNGGYGLLTVVGPTRMHYERTISSVFYVSQLLSRMLHAND
ncbi:MAG: HrcA family transcriptional regulator [Chloroflexia bacterium]